MPKMRCKNCGRYWFGWSLKCKENWCDCGYCMGDYKGKE